MILITFNKKNQAENNSIVIALNDQNLYLMKKFLAISTICLSSFLSFAQPQKGTWIIGGSGSVFFQRPTSNYPVDFRISAGVHPGIGRFVSDRLVLNGDLGYTYSLSKRETQSISTKSEEHSIGGGIGLTRFFSAGEKLFFTLNGSLEVGYARRINSSGSSLSNLSNINTTNQFRASVNLSPGLAYFINDYWMVTARIGSLFYELSDDDNYSSSVGHMAGYRFTANSFGIGVSYLIPSKKSE